MLRVNLKNSLLLFYVDTKLRLVQGPTKTSGYLEVNINNQWVAVCDRSWNKKNADVACRQMGFSGSLAGGWQSQFQWKYTQGRSDNAREFTDIQCKGYESSLDQCPRGGRGRNDPDYCRRYRAVVVCRPPGFDITGEYSTFRARVMGLLNRSMCSSGTG